MLNVAHVEPGDARDEHEERKRMSIIQARAVGNAVFLEHPGWSGNIASWGEPDADRAAFVAKAINDVLTEQVKELQARGEILDAVRVACGEGWWYGAADWRQKLRDFAEDTEQHDITHEQWAADNATFPGVVLYVVGGFYVAYFDHAAELWQHADDDRPMFHVMVQSDPPHRTAIHPLHLHAWVQHLTEICLPPSFCTVDSE